MSAVLDASAFLAYLRSEPGEDVVASALTHGAVISTANFAEVLAKLADAGADPEQVTTALVERSILGGTLVTEPFTDADAVASARLRPLTTGAGLSLGDRACLALGSRLGLPVLTADRAWAGLSVGVTVSVIR